MIRKDRVSATILSLVLFYFSYHLIHLASASVVNLVFYDQWDFLTPMFQGEPWWKMFVQQHGPHRQGLGGVLTYFIYEWSGWSSRVEALVAVACLLGACFTYLWAAFNLVGTFELWFVAIPGFVLSMSQWELFLGAQNLSHGPVPAFLVAILCILLMGDQMSWKRCLLLCAILPLTTFTGFAIFATPTIILISSFMLYGKWHEQRSHRVKWGLPIAVGLASLAAFSIGYVPMSAIECFEFPYHDLKQYAVFDGVLIGRAAGLFTGNTIDQISLFKLVPALVLFGLQIIAVIFVSSNIIRKNSVPKGSLAILFLCLFSLFFQTFSAIGRVCGGVSYAMSSRYVSYSVPGLIGVLFFLVQRWEFKFSSFTKGVVMAIALLAMVKEGRVLKRDAPFYNWYADGKTRWVECYKKTHDAKGCIQKEQFTVHPAPDDTHLTDKLNFLEAHKLNLFLD